MMRILHVLDHSIPLHSGYTFRTRAILEHQRALGWQTHQMTSPKHKVNDHQLLEETVDGFHFYRSPPVKPVWTQLPLFDQLAIINTLAKRLAHVVGEVKPDIIHAHSPALNGIAALWVGKRFSTPVIYECRAFWEDAAVDHGTARESGIRYRLTRALETFVFQRATAITTICEGLRKDIIGRGIAQEKVTVIPNAVDIERFTAHRPKDEQLLKALALDDKQVLGFIGSFYTYEGLHLLLQAFSIMLKKAPAIRLLLVGGGPQEDFLKQQADALNIKDRVIFTGRVPHDQVQRYYDLVDIFIYPRLFMRLTELVTPLKPLEAMAQGKLVVASDVGGHCELIRHRENGCLFPAGDAGALAETVLELLAHRERWPDLLRAGRRFVETERNWAASVARYQPLYDRLLK